MSDTIHTNTGHSESIINTHFQGCDCSARISCSDGITPMVFWNLFTGLQSTVYSVHHCKKIQINKFAKTRKFDPLQRLVAALCLTGRKGEYVEDTIVKLQ